MRTSVREGWNDIAPDRCRTQLFEVPPPGTGAGPVVYFILSYTTHLNEMGSYEHGEHGEPPAGHAQVQALVQLALLRIISSLL
jgi:hypothetical protein